MPDPVVAYIQDVDPKQCEKDLQHLIQLLGGIERFVRPGDRVFIKPNLVAPFDQAVTSQAVLTTVIGMVREAGGEPSMGDSSGFEFDTAYTFKALGLGDFAATYDIPCLNLDETGFVQVDIEDGPVRSLWIARPALEADVLINLPRLKRHSLTQVTLGMKNLFGLLRRDSRRQLHARDIEQGIVALNRIVRPDLTIVDGLTTLSRAVYGHTEALGVLVAGADLRTVDPFCAGLLGINPKTVPHIAQFAGDSPHLEIVGDTPVPVHFPSSRENSLSKRLYRLVFQGMYAADRLYAALLPGRSLIPMVHYWLGIRPAIRRRECIQCGDCTAVCPADAIDLSDRRIIASACMRLRCLRCVEACPMDAIEVKGWRRPGQ
jgi:uncharacterized protein (DUF362 family)/Pyruvate/2-oxoacid:ferredoxin oxidoreductase delta subunit